CRRAVEPLQGGGRHRPRLQLWLATPRWRAVHRVPRGLLRQPETAGDDQHHRWARGSRIYRRRRRADVQPPATGRGGRPEDQRSLDRGSGVSQMTLTAPPPTDIVDLSSIKTVKQVPY